MHIIIIIIILDSTIKEYINNYQQVNQGRFGTSSAWIMFWLIYIWNRRSLDLSSWWLYNIAKPSLVTPAI